MTETYSSGESNAYVYDTVGNITQETVTTVENGTSTTTVTNYTYDSETGYYYLQSRYYDPSICRFINSDIPEIAQESKSYELGQNLFAYCCNEPVNNVDATGYADVFRTKSSIYTGNTHIKDLGKQHISEKGIKMLKACEGFDPVAKKYSGETYYTIGYGRYSSKVHKGDRVTKAQADKYLRNDIKAVEKQLNAFTKKYKIEMYQYQFDACLIDSYQKGEYIWSKSLCFKYNLPLYLYRHQYFLDRKKIIYKEVENAFVGSTSNSGLKKRRKAEARLFCNGIYCTKSNQIYG